MPHPIYEMIEKVTDEKSFNAFLTALRKDCEWHERNGGRHDRMECVEGQHFEAHSTRDFLKSMEDWATGGDFAEGQHYGEPILRRIAAMMWVGRLRWPEHDDQSGDERD
ncbi:MAG: hypothetical protein M3P06_12625 [Acidobacteriota bacterium]|nr:hypothetical protein [Acidobacteriota bacterium]